MDRREALRKLAMGTVVVGASTQVLTRPAFADGGTLSYRPTSLPSAPTITASLSGSRRSINMTLAVPSGGSCLTTSGGPSTPRRDTAYSASLVGGAFPTSFTVAQNTWVNNRTSITTRGTITNAGTGNRWTAGQQVTVRFYIRYVCRGSAAGRAAWVCRSYQTTLTITSTSTINNSGFTTTTGLASCDSPAPTAP